MHHHTSLDPESKGRIQQLVNLFLEQSTKNIKRKLQKLQGLDGRNLEAPLNKT
ncbi:hypothetical protein Nmel_005541 [Mimus melanotis]